MQLTYQHSIILPCYCQASKMYNENKKITPIRLDNRNNLVSGHVIEKRVDLDEYDREHIKTINHCVDCKRNIEEFGFRHSER